MKIVHFFLFIINFRSPRTGLRKICPSHLWIKSSSGFKTHPPEPEASSASQPTSVLHLSLSRPHALAIKFTLQSASSIAFIKKEKKRNEKDKKKKKKKEFQRKRNWSSRFITGSPRCNRTLFRKKMGENREKLKKRFLRGLARLSQMEN